MNGSTGDGKVLIVSCSDSFLAKSLTLKLKGENIKTEFVHAEINEIKPHADDMELVILFMSEELEMMTKTLVYLKDILEDKQVGLFLIGDQQQYDIIKKTIPEQFFTEWIKRPLDIELLIKKTGDYLDDNTGAKRRKTILIVDDDITYMRTVFEWIKDRYHVGMASNGVQAIGYLAKNKADLILLDYEMPIANGPQVLSMLKNDSETGNIPVMFLTGHSDRQSVMSVVDLNPVDYLLKTIDKETLLKKLEMFFIKNQNLK